MNEAGLIDINGTAFVRTTNFKHLGSRITFESNARSCLMRERSVDQVALDDMRSLRKEDSRTPSKIYKTVIRPVAMYGDECSPATKEVETLLSAMVAKMLL
ncbi:unnamed protein product [Heligmosomoides polygyrus]|uniref:DNA-directed RNA polymerase n=1 Tax=Heligmosomoides polygyrus TaxID=6339 RepID=A0A183GCL1_HELPZ|nr:unnamed protein product [Heligmosomoides polygyrus]